MSTIVNIEDRNSSEYRVLCKGAPEVIKTFLREVPEGYDRCYLKYVKNGARVLALAWKALPKKSSDSYVTLKREEAESDLTFCGFIVSDCPLKDHTHRVINELKASNHMVKMITGDN
jgi:cation-transporting ATPase 13A1